MGEEVAVIGEVGECCEVRGNHAGALVTWSWHFQGLHKIVYVNSLAFRFLLDLLFLLEK